MPEALSFIEIDRQRLELLPTRTVMSMFVRAPAGDGGTGGLNGNTQSTASPTADPMTQQLNGVMGIMGKLPVVGSLMTPPK